MLAYEMMGVADSVAMRFIVWTGSTMSDGKIQEALRLGRRTLGLPEE
jgi:hypothetical protein